MKISNDKKGQLLPEETVKVVIAVLCILALAFLLFSLYNAKKNAEQLEFAKESIELLSQGIDDGITSVDIYNPKNWNIGTWPHEIQLMVAFKEGSRPEGKEMQFPMFCSNLGWTNCICICQVDSAEGCDDEGICINNEKKLEISGPNQYTPYIRIKDPPITLRIDYTNKKISEA